MFLLLSWRSSRQCESRAGPAICSPLSLTCVCEGGPTRPGSPPSCPAPPAPPTRRNLLVCLALTVTLLLCLAILVCCHSHPPRLTQARLPNCPHRLNRQIFCEKKFRQRFVVLFRKQDSAENAMERGRGPVQCMTMCELSCSKLQPDAQD